MVIRKAASSKPVPPKAAHMSMFSELMSFPKLIFSIAIQANATMAAPQLRPDQGCTIHNLTGVSTHLRSQHVARLQFCHVVNEQPRPLHWRCKPRDSRSTHDAVEIGAVSR